MKVKAKRMGYYNHIRRREGDVFELHDKSLFSKSWMEKLGGGEPVAEPKPKVASKSKKQEPSEDDDSVI